MFDWQDSLTGFLFEGQESALDLSNIKGVGKLSALESLYHYKNGYQNSLKLLLRNRYSVLRGHIGDKKFEEFISGYILAFPSDVYSLDDYGKGFPSWINAHFTVKKSIVELAIFENLVEEIEFFLPYIARKNAIRIDEKIEGQNYVLNESKLDLVSLWNGVDSEIEKNESQTSFYQLIYYNEVATQVRAIEKWQFNILDDLSENALCLESVVGHAENSDPTQITEFFKFLTKYNLISNKN